LRGGWFVLRASASQPHRLLVGGFESEGMLLQPTGRPYRLSGGDPQ